MKIGTKSVLFGDHCFLIHPLFVALAWWKIYGFPFDPRLWVAFFVHDLGYIGKCNMDGEEGETHPELGARIMGTLFDFVDEAGIYESCPNPDCEGGMITTIESSGEWNVTECRRCTRDCLAEKRWYRFTLYHSRFYSKKVNAMPSRLCAADKLATALTPRWIYLPCVKLSGELAEFMRHAFEGKYERDKCHEGLAHKRMGTLTPEIWHAAMIESCRRWTVENKNACTPV